MLALCAIAVILFNFYHTCTIQRNLVIGTLLIHVFIVLLPFHTTSVPCSSQDMRTLKFAFKLEPHRRRGAFDALKVSNVLFQFFANAFQF